MDISQNNGDMKIKRLKIFSWRNSMSAAMRRSPEFLLMMLVVSMKLSCGFGKKQSDGEGGSFSLPPPYSGEVGSGSYFAFSNSGVFDSKVIRATSVSQAKDPKRDLFATGGMHKVLTLRCTPCHAGRNDFPFASPGVDLAWVTFKKYVAPPIENSKVLLQLRSRHNGADPAWEADFKPLMQALETSP